MQNNKKKKQNLSKKNEAKKKNRFLIIFVSVFVSAVLILGVTLGAVAIIKDGNSTVSFRGTRMDKKVAVYFTSVFKKDFKTALSTTVSGVEDSPGFWNSISETGETYLEVLSAGAEEYLKRIAVLNYLYDRYASLSSKDKAIIENAVLETLKNYGGSVSEFNEAASVYGFDYNAYKSAVEMIYKAVSIETLICGDGGSKLKSSSEENVLALKNKLLAEYSHVKLLYISTDRTFVLDENGNRVSEGGEYKIKELNPSERAERLDEIEKIREAISAIGTDGAQMGPDMFDYYMKSGLYAGMLETRDHGYYFLKGSSYTDAFYKDNAEIVDKSFEMNVGEFAEVAAEGGVCFIYKMPTSETDLSVSALEAYFIDFYDALSVRFINEQVSLFTPEVKIKEELFGEIDLIILPYNSEIEPSFS